MTSKTHEGGEYMLDDQIKKFIKKFPKEAEEYVREFEKYLGSSGDLDAWENVEAIAVIVVKYFTNEECLSYITLYNLLKQNLELEKEN